MRTMAVSAHAEDGGRTHAVHVFQARPIVNTASTPDSSNSPMDTFDVIIVGAGPAGLFAAYYLCEHSHLRVLVIEKGKGILSDNDPVQPKIVKMISKEGNRESPFVMNNTSAPIAIKARA